MCLILATRASALQGLRIGFHGLVHDTLQGYVVLGRNLLAIFILRGVVGDRAIPAGTLQADVPPARHHINPFSRQRLALLLATPYSQRAGLRENYLGQPGSVL